MRAGLIILCLAYVLSQFFRAFLAVLVPALERDLGVTADQLAFASGLWFLAFAVMQLPVGWALDRLGPRRTASVLLLTGGAGGATVFALAQTGLHINAAMLLIGVGCSPVLMASYYIFARQFPVARFATLAALMLGIGSVGNLIASYPTAIAAETIGWRGTMAGLAGMSAAVALGILALVRDPPPVADAPVGSVWSLLRIPALWLIFPLMMVNYAPAGALRGLWAGPYLSDLHGLTAPQIGQVTLIMGISMILGTLLIGPLDRQFGTRKWVIVTANALCAAALTALALGGTLPLGAKVALIAGIGLTGASFPVIIAHGRSFFPAHLTGRGVTLMNFFGIGGVGLMQLASGSLHTALAASPPTHTAYTAIFLFFALALIAGLIPYLFSRDSMD